MSFDLFCSTNGMICQYLFKEDVVLEVVEELGT